MSNLLLWRLTFVNLVQLESHNTFLYYRYLSANTNNCSGFTIAWACNRVIYLDTMNRYEDSYAVSQEFCEWTTSIDSYPELLKSSTLIVPKINKENRTYWTTRHFTYPPEYLILVIVFRSPTSNKRLACNLFC